MDSYEIIKILQETEDTNNLLLIKALTKKSGFFCNDKKLIFISEDDMESKNEGVETEYLKLQTHIKISSVKNDQTFKDGYYNLIIYNSNIENGNIHDFINLCVIYSNNEDELSFKEFFYSLISIFQLPSEKKYVNAIGLYGELKFLEHCLKKYKVDLSLFWHKKGPLSQYDFTSDNEFIEIKSNANGTNVATIKHNQIFDTTNGYLVLVSAYINDIGETIEEVLERIKSEGDFNNINFNINVTKELKRISEKDYKQVRFILNSIKMYKTKDINPFAYIPDGVRELNYKFDLSNYDDISEDKIKDLICSFKR